MIPSFLRPIGSYFVPEIKNCLNEIARARDLLTPIIKEREEAENKLGYGKPNDAIEWVRDLPEVDKKDYGYQGVVQLAIGAVSIHTVAQLTTNTIFNLATYPEYVPILRDEIDTVLAESGGEFTLESMSKLKKLDSFLKETLRFNTSTTSKHFQASIHKIPSDFHGPN
jgi:cytochrome P450